MYDCSEREGQLEVMTAPLVEAFLLVQGHKVLDVRGAPHLLDFDKLDEFADWQVYAGAYNERHEREIVGAIAKAWLIAEFSKYTLSIKETGMQSSVMFAASELPSEVVRDALRRLFREGKFLDPANLATVYLFAA
jgi:hypothetical protein